MNRVLEEISKIGIIPVIKIDDEKDALPLAKSLINGGLNCAEITFRSDAAKKAIKIINDECKGMLVGAGTVINKEQVDEAIEAGAKFIISPGYIDEVVDYCITKNILVIPGCSNASEVAKAVNHHVNVVKFFPAEASGGIEMINAFVGPYGKMRFIPTGGIDECNLKEYLDKQNIIACGGTWMVKGNLIKEKKFDEIESLTKKAVNSMLGYEMTHVGINLNNELEANETCDSFSNLFGFEKKENPNSIFAGKYVEAMKTPFYGKKGHLAIATNYVDRAMYQLSKQGVKFKEESIVYDDNNIPTVAYLENEIGGFAIHLVKKN